jgi:hypothetical protein
MVHGVSDKKTYSRKPPKGKMTIKVRLNEINTIIHLKKYSVYPKILILYSNSYISENITTLYH